MRSNRGSTLVESSIVLLLFLVILIGVLDLGQVLFFHHFLTERARSGARYAAVHTFNATAVANFVAYNNPSPQAGAQNLFGLSPSMITVAHYDTGTSTERVEVRIAGYSMRFLSPWLAGTFTPGPFRAIMPAESMGAAN